MSGKFLLAILIIITVLLSACNFSPSATATASPDTLSLQVDSESATATRFSGVTLTPTPSSVLTIVAADTETASPAPTLTDTPTATDTPVTPTSEFAGEHVIQAGDTYYCIGRAYGVLPSAIQEANDFTALTVGEILVIPREQWEGVPAGLRCISQFPPPYPTGIAASAPLVPLNPDSDGDGIPDSSDACPQQGPGAGGLTTDGCPILNSPGGNNPPPPSSSTGGGAPPSAATSAPPRQATAVPVDATSPVVRQQPTTPVIVTRCVRGRPCN